MIKLVKVYDGTGAGEVEIMDRSRGAPVMTTAVACAGVNAVYLVSNVSVTFRKAQIFLLVFKIGT